VPGDGTKNRSQPWQPVPALCDADNAIDLDGDDRPAMREVDQEVIGPASNCNSAVSLNGSFRRPCGLIEGADCFARQAMFHDYAVLGIQLDEHCIATVT
jgi:hypothetical protein